MLSIGTDCSGIEAPCFALKNLNIQFRHKFSCEIDNFAKKSLLANHQPEILYDDMTQDRNLEKVDIYVCGFSCQPFSTIGKRKGKDDSRGNLFLHCVEAIKKCEPKLFILENVSGLKTIHNGEYFEFIKSTLNSLDKYNVYYWILNTKDYGIPQNRKRLYIIGMSKDNMIREPKIPAHKVCKPIEDFIDHTCISKESYYPSHMKKYELFKDSVFCTLASIRPDSKYKANPSVCSCITTNPVWCVKMNRRATIQEVLALQGFPKDFKVVCSRSQINKQIGNSMSVNVLEEIFKETLGSLKF